MRISTKPSIARLTWALVEGKPKPGNPVAAKVKTETKWWKTRNAGRTVAQEAWKLANPEIQGEIAQ
jgi:hypothetical protein